MWLHLRRYLDAWSFLQMRPERPGRTLGSASAWPTQASCSSTAPGTAAVKVSAKVSLCEGSDRKRVIACSGDDGSLA